LRVWISKKHLEEQSRLLLPKEYVRLWLNQEVDSDGDSLSAADIKACTTLGRGPKQPRMDRLYIAGLDIGVLHDRSALCIVGCDPLNGVAEVVSVQSWHPKDYGGEIDISIVESAILAAHKRYGLMSLLADPSQARFLLQRLADAGVPVGVKDFVPANIDAMALALIDGFRNRQLLLIEDEQLHADLLRLRIKSNAFGKRKLTAISDEAGHADAAISLAIIAPEVLEIARSGISLEYAATLTSRKCWFQSK